MKKDQNRIELNVRRGIYEEFALSAEDTSSYIVPGTILSMTNVGDTDELLEIQSQTEDIQGFEPCVVLENALLGKTINAKQYAGDCMLVRRLVSGDMYLLRAVAGTYTTGEPVYATQTDNGIFVSADGEGRFVGWVQENYTVTPEMIGLIDDSTLERPSTIPMNGRLVNLLRVRIGKRNKAGTPVANYTVTADGNATDANTTKLTINITRNADLVTTDITSAEIAIAPATVATAETLTKIDATTYELTVSTLSSGTITLTITKEGVTPRPKSATIYKHIPVGFWGVAYPDSRTIGPSATPTAAEITALSSLNTLVGDKRNIEVAFTLHEADWTAAGGTGTFPDACAGRAFFITTNWGNASSIVSNGFNVTEAFDEFTVVIDNITYTGYLANGSPVAYDGATYAFTFVA